MGLDPRAQVAVLLMAYGSPESLEDMEAYLLDVRGGRPTPPDLVQEIQHRYAQIGGRSPLLEITRQQAVALEAELNRRNPDSDPRFHTFVGMRHWQPRIASAVAEIKALGYRQIVAMVMAPHSSHMSTGAYFARLNEALVQENAPLHVLRITEWYNHPRFIQAVAEHAREGLRKFQGVNPLVIFSAHSLPVRILAQGNTYDAQLRETAQLVAAQLGLSSDRWLFCYQSAGQSSGPWLGPPIEEVILQHIQEGERNFLSVPIGFVCDHVEVLYDIDIAARQLATRHDARLERSESLNDSPLFISTLADLVFDALRGELNPDIAASQPSG
jgi:ferrochelatase